MTQHPPDPDETNAEIRRRLECLDLRAEFVAEGRESWIIADSEAQPVVERATDVPAHVVRRAQMDTEQRGRRDPRAT